MLANLSLTEVTHVIALATAPSFLLGAVVAFLSLLITRAGRVSDQLRALDALPAPEERARRVAAELPRLRHRARLIHASIALSIASCVATALIIVMAFLGALLGIHSESVVAILFVVSLGVFVGALYLFAHEALLSLGEFRRFG